MRKRRKPTRKPITRPPQDEDGMLRGILDTMARTGWLAHHVRRMDLGVAAGDTGYPDITACHPGRGLFLVLELKSDTGRYEPGQREWLAAFRGAGVDARTVWPADYDALIEELAGERLISISGRRAG